MALAHAQSKRYNIDELSQACYFRTLFENDGPSIVFNTPYCRDLCVPLCVTL